MNQFNFNRCIVRIENHSVEVQQLEALMQQLQLQREDLKRELFLLRSDVALSQPDSEPRKDPQLQGLALAGLATLFMLGR